MFGKLKPIAELTDRQLDRRIRKVEKILDRAEERVRVEGLGEYINGYD